MTEEQWRKLEGTGKTPKEYHFFVKEEKEAEFLNFLSLYNLERNIEMKKGDGILLFLISISGRKDYWEIRDILTSKQPAFL